LCSSLIDLLYSMHFRILKIIATSGLLTALECTKFVFGRGSAPDPAQGDYSAPHDSVPFLMGAVLLRRREWKGKRGRKREEREKREDRDGMEGKGSDGKEKQPILINSCIRPWLSLVGLICGSAAAWHCTALVK